MFGWLKNLFGGKKKTDPVVVNTAPATVEAPKKEEPKVEQPKPVAKTKKQAKKPAPKKKAATKTASADLDSMNKTQLLAEAKKRGVKANASLKKAEILEAIKNG
jgi:hypothetical protein